LQFLEFIASGKAARSERPILLKREFYPAKKAASEKLRSPMAKKPLASSDDTVKDVPPDEAESFLQTKEVTGPESEEG